MDSGNTQEYSGKKCITNNVIVQRLVNTPV